MRARAKPSAAQEAGAATQAASKPASKPASIPVKKPSSKATPKPAARSASKSTPKPASKRKATPRHHHSVYVIELSPEVLQEARFRRANPDYDATKPCVYVGMTGLTPERRFENHRKGIKSNRYAHQYGLRLLPRLYAVYNPMPYRAAQEMEVELAIGLREEGYGVWQA